jgi:hypothetical protein
LTTFEGHEPSVSNSDRSEKPRFFDYSCPMSRVATLPGSHGKRSSFELFPKAVDGRDKLSGDSFSIDEHDAVDQVNVPPRR